MGYEKLKKKGAFKLGKEATFTQIMTQSKLPWMPLNLKFPRAAMLKEALAVRDRFIGHRVGGQKGYYDSNKGWLALPIHAISVKHTEHPGAYGYTEKTAPYQWTEIADLCPITTRFFKETYPCKEYYRVRFTILQPGGYIRPHTDGKDAMLWYINLALSNPKGFYFKMKGHGYVPFEEGKAMMLDTTNIHALVNLSNEERVHMIVHGMPLREKKFQIMVKKSYQEMCKAPTRFYKLHE